MEQPGRVEIDAGTRVTLSWQDGSQTELAAPELRAACPCATCREPAGVEAIEALLAGDAEIRIRGAEFVGAYAINFHFEPDGHHTGIYTFDALRSLGEAVHSRETPPST